MAMLQHTLGIFLNPDSEWKAIREDKSSFKQVFLSHIPFLALIPALASFYGVTQVGWSVGSGEAVKLTVESALSLSALTYVALIAGIFVLGEFINWMAKTYGVAESEEQRHYEGTALAVFASTPLFLVGVFNAYPSIWLNATAMLIAGAYSVYLIYEGLPIVMNIDKDRAFMYASSVVTVGLVLMVTAMISTVLLWGMGIGPIYVD
ncbi:Yip1 family protein [Teredinibacter sp. KSP-S5-2]|uniref:Yip1 family protein n=1 Tax=Teredinibacter sp. KSP-S5-2 TaxID=3034506 RepID=UPI0029348F9E|nr:Yip1 family protein [Teredinibacter sp. KSP-S5-2]WNO08532.1 Yip1 family protein [Teredinibacter sp. KSP-S5-2]